MSDFVTTDPSGNRAVVTNDFRGAASNGAVVWLPARMPRKLINVAVPSLTLDLEGHSLPHP